VHPFLLYTIFNILKKKWWSYIIPYYMHAICHACTLFLSFVKMAWLWSVGRNMSSS